MTKKEILKLIDYSEPCMECEWNPTLFIAFEGYLICGCDKHMIDFASEKLRHTKYYKRYLNLEGHSEKSKYKYS